MIICQFYRFIFLITMPFTLAPLTYPYNACEPFLDETTMHIHHSKHHQTYVDKLNAWLVWSPYESWTLNRLCSDIATIPEPYHTVIKHHGWGHRNHTFFWDILTPWWSNNPSWALLTAIKQSFWSLGAMKDAFIAQATTVFGSGWAWVIVDNGSLRIMTTPNQENPLMKGYQPILGIDVREHAYYLKFQNRRLDYIQAFRSCINRDRIVTTYEKAIA